MVLSENSALPVYFIRQKLYNKMYSNGLGSVCSAADYLLEVALLCSCTGSVLFYWNVLMRFMENSSSWHRLAPTEVVWQALAALLLLSSLARALYLPKPENGRTLCAAGLAALCLCLCWELPHAAVLAAGAAADPALLPELFAALALCCVGALGGVCAAACARRPE